MGQILTKAVFFLEMSHFPPNYVFFCFEAFSANSLEIFLFNQKCDYLRKEHRNNQKVFFLKKFKRGKS